MKKILIISEKYSSNLGDSLIYSIVDSIFSKKYITDSVDLSGRTNFIYGESSNSISNINLLNKVYRKIKKFSKQIGFSLNGNSMRKVKKNFKDNFAKKMNEFNPDCILFAGGQMFIESFFSQIIYVVKYCKKNQIPVYFNACGCSNKMFLYEKKYIKKILNSSSVKYVSVRDKYEIVKKYDKRNIVFETFDTALLSNSIIERKCFSKNIIGIGIMYSEFYSYEQQFNFWSSILKKIEGMKLNYKIFCNGSIDDYNFINDICKKNKINISRVCSCPRTYKELINIICKFNVILSMRLHSLIIAYSYRIPAVAISWDSKVEEFYKKTLNDKFCFNLDSYYEEIIDVLLSLLKKTNKINFNSKIEQDINSNLNRIFELINDN